MLLKMRYRKSIGALFVVLFYSLMTTTLFADLGTDPADLEGQGGEVATTSAAAPGESEPAPAASAAPVPANSGASRGNPLFPTDVDWGRALAVSGFAILLVTGALYILDAKGIDVWRWRRKPAKGTKTVKEAKAAQNDKSDD